VEASWKWRSNYRVWDANQKVFLFPENWIEPEDPPASRIAVELRQVVTSAQQRHTSLLLTSARPAVSLQAGHRLAAALARDLYRVDLRGVASKFIGETEKDLNIIFDRAEQAHVVLFFDEADALFGKRSEAGSGTDRFDNAAVAYLLQKIEAFNGLSVVATNSKRATVQPLLRHFPFIIDSGGDVKSPASAQ